MNKELTLTYKTALKLALTNVKLNCNQTFKRRQGIHVALYLLAFATLFLAMHQRIFSHGFTELGTEYLFWIKHAFL